MAQQTVVRSIPEYPFKILDMEIVAWSSSGQGMAISGTTWSANNATVGVSSANATTTRNYVIPDLTKTFTRTPIDENTVYIISLDHIDTDGAKLQFAEPITASIAYHDNAYFCQNEDFGIFSKSAELEDCIKDFQEEVLFIWKEYGEEDDSKLTDDAKELKTKILSRIKQ